MLSKFLAVPLLICVLAASPSPAKAQDEEPYPDRFSLTVSGFLMKHIKTGMQVSATGAPLGTRIDLADDLDVENDNQVLRVDGYYRFGFRHRVDAGWYHFVRKGQTTLGKDIQFGPVLFERGTEVSSKTTNDLLKIAYTYSFYRVEQVELGVQIGFHFFDIGLDIDAPEADKNESGGGLLPLPNLGFTITYKVNPRLVLKQSGQFFFIAIGDYAGSLTDFWISGEYRVIRNLSVGAGFNRFVLDVDAKSDEFTGNANATFNGFALYLTGRL